MVYQRCVLICNQRCGKRQKSKLKKSSVKTPTLSRKRRETRAGHPGIFIGDSASAEDNLGMEERAGYTCGDGDEVVLSGEDLH